MLSLILSGFLVRLSLFVLEPSVALIMRGRGLDGCRSERGSSGDVVEELVGAWVVSKVTVRTWDLVL